LFYSHLVAPSACLERICAPYLEASLKWLVVGLGKESQLAWELKTVTAAQSTREEKEGRKGSLRWEMILSEESCWSHWTFTKGLMCSGRPSGSIDVLKIKTTSLPV
jgi:hypothetical protein